MSHTNPDGMPDFIQESEVADNLLPQDIVDELAAAAGSALPEVALFTVSPFTAEQFALKILEIANQYLGVSRATDLAQVAKFLSIFGLNTRDNGEWVPFCAAGIAYSAAKAYCELAGIAFTPDTSIAVFQKILPVIKARVFLPSASTGAMKANAIGRGNWVSHTVSPSEIKKGWFVLYNWKGGTAPQHIGIVESAGDSLHTTEFNTSTANNSNGGAVSHRERAYACVVGYIKLY